MKSRLKKFRLNKGMSQVELAAKLGVTPNYIHMTEKGTTPFTDRMVKDICNTFHLREEWLRYGEEPIFIDNAQEAEKVDWLLESLKDPLKTSVIEWMMTLSDKQWAFIGEMIDFISDKKRA